ncbi:MAG: MerR family transcriptional regulator [Acidimicrobiales bacterium]
MTDREHLSIGEVLSLLQAEFPDVTISKIRFLESQGLIDPERTPSGYRKFYDADVARLRWILVQQRDHFLPLKVIKDRLEGGAVELPFDPPLPGDAPPEAGVDGVASPSGPAASGTGADGDPAGREVAPGDGGDGPGDRRRRRCRVGRALHRRRRRVGPRPDGGRGDGGRGQGAVRRWMPIVRSPPGRSTPSPMPLLVGRAGHRRSTCSPALRPAGNRRTPPARPAGDEPGDGPGPGAAAGRATGEGDGEEAGGEEPTGRGARGAAAGATPPDPPPGPVRARRPGACGGGRTAGRRGGRTAGWRAGRGRRAQPPAP